MSITKLKTKRFLSLLFMGFAFLFVLIPAIAPKSLSTANASFGFCADLGSGLQRGSGHVDTNSVVASDAPNRKWTIQELFGDSVHFTVYNGESESADKGNFLLYNTMKEKDKKGRGDGYKDWGNDEVMKKLQSQRTFSRCLFGGISTVFGDLFLGLSNAIVKLGGLMVAQLFNPTFICSDPAHPTGCTINLIATIGGVSNNPSEGLIGNLFNSIYLPLVSMAFLATAGWLIYKGLFKRELRASFSGILWGIVIFFVGIMAMSNPVILASAPQKVNSTIGSCIIGAMNGQNCATGTVTAPSSLVGPECMSGASTSGDNGAQLAINGMTCSIWKAFVLNTWTVAQFGRNYNELYTQNAPNGGSVWSVSNELGKKSNYCINLKSTGSAESFGSKTVKLNGGDQVCNLALTQLYLRSGIESTANTASGSDNAYYNIIIPATKDSAVWNSWAPASLSGSTGRYLTPIVALLITIVAMFSLVIFAFKGLVYSFAGTILMAFSPLFFLVAIHPGKGKRIFLGWLSSVLSSVLKYMASALFVIIALAMYSGILNSTSNYMQAFLGILIMVGVMFTYRKEIINLLGVVDLGGEKISNAVGEKLQDKADKAKELTAYGVGSALGAKMAGGSATGGFGEGLSRRLRRDNTFVGGMMREEYMTRRQLQKDNKDNLDAEGKIPEPEEKIDLNKPSDGGDNPTPPDNNTPPTPTPTQPATGAPTNGTPLTPTPPASGSTPAPQAPNTPKADVQDLERKLNGANADTSQPQSQQPINPSGVPDDLSTTVPPAPDTSTPNNQLKQGGIDSVPERHDIDPSAPDNGLENQMSRNARLEAMREANMKQADIKPDTGYQSELDKATSELEQAKRDVESARIAANSEVDKYNTAKKAGNVGDTMRYRKSSNVAMKNYNAQLDKQHSMEREVAKAQTRVSKDIDNKRNDAFVRAKKESIRADKQAHPEDYGLSGTLNRAKDGVQGTLNKGARTVNNIEKTAQKSVERLNNRRPRK